MALFWKSSGVKLPFDMPVELQKHCFNSETVCSRNSFSSSFQGYQAEQETKPCVRTAPTNLVFAQPPQAVQTCQKLKRCCCTKLSCSYIVSFLLRMQISTRKAVNWCCLYFYKKYHKRILINDYFCYRGT